MVIHNMPYSDFHDLNLDWIIKIVKELKEIVDQIDIDTINQKFSIIESTLSEHQSDIEQLQNVSSGLVSSLESLTTLVNEHSQDLEQIHSQIDGVIDQISEAVTDLQSEIGDLETDYNNFKTATNTSIYNLNQAAFDPSQIVMSNSPFNYAISTLNGNKSGMRIVVDGSGSTTDSIQWVDGGQYDPTNIPQKQKFTQKFKIPRFYSSGNQAHLVIPSVFPIKYGASINWGLYFYANRWIGGTSPNTGIVKVGPINFTDLLTEGGYSISGSPSSGSACFNDMELFPNLNTGCYDLYIYNGRNGHYCWIDNYMFSSLMILPIDLGTMTDAQAIQRYFNLLNTYSTQSTSDIDGKISSAVNELRSEVNGEISDIRSDMLDFISKTDLTSLSFTENLGITVNSNNSYIRKEYGVDTLDRVVQVIECFIDIIVTITDLGSASVAVGQFDFSPDTLNSTHSISVDILHENNGSYGSVTNNGTLNIHAYGTFDSSTQLRIHGSFADRKIVTT